MVKMIRKSITLMLAFCLVIALSATAFADQGNSKKISKKDLKAREIVQDIANGSDTPVGNDIILHGTVEEEKASEGDITPQWSSGGWDHTHQFLAARGITILENDKTWSIAQHLYESNGTSVIMKLSDLNESHHASNMIAVITNHAEYESWVDARRTDYGITSSSKYNDYSADSFATYCNKIADDSAENAYIYRNAASASEAKDINYDFAAENTLPYNQQEIAAFLYRFLKAVNEI